MGGRIGGPRDVIDTRYVIEGKVHVQLHQLDCVSLNDVISP